MVLLKNNKRMLNIIFESHFDELARIMPAMQLSVFKKILSASFSI